MPLVQWVNLSIIFSICSSGGVQFVSIAGVATGTQGMCNMSARARLVLRKDSSISERRDKVRRYSDSIHLETRFDPGPYLAGIIFWPLFEPARMHLCRLEAENRPPQFIDLLHVMTSTGMHWAPRALRTSRLSCTCDGDIGVYVLIIVSPGFTIGYTNANAAQVTVQLVRVIGHLPVAAA